MFLIVSKTILREFGIGSEATLQRHANMWEAIETLIYTFDKIKMFKNIANHFKSKYQKFQYNQIWKIVPPMFLKLFVYKLTFSCVLIKLTCKQLSMIVMFYFCFIFENKVELLVLTETCVLVNTAIYLNPCLQHYFSFK